MEYEPVACFTLDYLRSTYPDRLCARFKLDPEQLEQYSSSAELLNLIGTKRGCLRSGGIVDEHQAATIVLNELRSGKLGAICLETPEMMQEEMAVFLAELEARRASENSQSDLDLDEASDTP